MRTPQDRIGSRRVIVSVSGGKDSAATSLYLRELGIEHVRVFADTGWERAETYDYLRGELTRVLGPIVEVRGLLQWADLVRKKAIFPDRTKQFCTTDLKLKPIRQFRDTFDEDVVNVIGVRRAESERRKKALEWEWSDTMDERGKRERALQGDLFEPPGDGGTCGEWGLCETSER